jgi:hypothetical protein
VSCTVPGASARCVVVGNGAEACCGCRGALAGQDTVVAEVQLMQKVIAVMVNNEGTLVEMQVPEQRKEKERVLMINPNYYMEVLGTTACLSKA